MVRHLLWYSKDKFAKPIPNSTYGRAETEDLGNGWYECTLSGKVFADNIKVLFGQTNEQMKARSWESKIKDKADIII